MLTLLVLPSVRASADRLVVSPVVAPAIVRTLDLPGTRPTSFAISPIHSGPVQVATMPRSAPVTQPRLGPSAGEGEKEMLPKPRRMTREGCEAPLSSLVGPEARRMVPGRCMA